MKKTYSTIIGVFNNFGRRLIRKYIHIYGILENAKGIKRNLLAHPNNHIRITGIDITNCEVDSSLDANP